MRWARGGLDLPRCDMVAKQDIQKKDPKVMEFSDAESWRVWLHDHYELHEGVLLKIAKKHSKVTTIKYPEALEIALCYGWIDGKLNKLDDSYFLLKFTPRRPKSIWSKRNVGIAERLIAQGKMRPPGLKAIEAAKADGRWENAY